MTTLTGSFTVQMTPAEALTGADGRFELVKTWSGGIEGTSHGLMLTAGDPASGSAGYIASETFEGAIDGRRGTVALQQLGTMDEGEPVLHYVIAPGSATGELVGITGELVIGEIDEDGVHQVSVELS